MGGDGGADQCLYSGSLSEAERLDCRNTPLAFFCYILQPPFFKGLWGNLVVHIPWRAIDTDCITDVNAVKCLQRLPARTPASVAPGARSRVSPTPRFFPILAVGGLTHVCRLV